MYQYKIVIIANNKYIDKTGPMRRLICAINVSRWYEHIKFLDLVCINAKLANVSKVFTCCSLNRRLTYICNFVCLFVFYYENTPIQIYWKFYHQNMKIFR